MFAGQDAELLNRLLNHLCNPGLPIDAKTADINGFIGHPAADDDGAGVGTGGSVASDAVCPSTEFKLPITGDISCTIKGDLMTQLFCLAAITGRDYLTQLYQHVEATYPQIFTLQQRQKMLRETIATCSAAEAIDDAGTALRMQTVHTALIIMLQSPAFLGAATQGSQALKQGLMHHIALLSRTTDGKITDPRLIAHRTAIHSAMHSVLRQEPLIAAAAALPDAEQIDIIRQVERLYHQSILGFDPDKLSTAAQLERARELLFTTISQKTFLRHITLPDAASGAGAATPLTLTKLLKFTETDLSPAQQDEHRQTTSQLLGFTLQQEAQALAGHQLALNQQHAEQREWDTHVATLRHRDEAPTEQEATDHASKQGQLTKTLKHHTDARTGYEVASTCLVKELRVPIMDSSHAGVPVLAMVRNHDDNTIAARLVRDVIWQVFDQHGWDNPTTTRPESYESATDAARAYGFRCMRLLDQHATDIGHRVGFMPVLLGLMADEFISDEQLRAAEPDTISLTINHVLNTVYPKGADLAAQDEKDVSPSQLFWYRELNLLSHVVAKLLDTKHTMLTAADADSEPTKQAYLALCGVINDWQPHLSPLDTLKRQLTAQTSFEKFMLSWVQTHEHPDLMSDARAAYHTPRASSANSQLTGIISFMAMLSMTDLATNPQPNWLSAFMPLILGVSSAASIPTEPEPEKLIISTAKNALQWQLLQAATSWGLMIAESAMGSTLVSPDTLRRTIVPGAALGMRCLSLLSGALSA